MKRKALALLLCLILALSLAACGNNTQNAGGNAAENAGETAGAEETADNAEDAGALKVGVFYYAFSDTYISTVRTALDAELTARGIAFQNYDANNSQASQNEQIQALTFWSSIW